MALAEYLAGPKSEQSANSGPPPPPVDSATKMRKKVFVQFGAFVALGLALAGWYVGYRIFAGRRVARPAAPVAIVAKPVPAQLAPVPKPAPSQESKPVEVTPVTAPVAKPVKTPEVAQQPSKPVQGPTASAPAVKQIAATAEVVKAPPSVKRKESALQPFIRHDAKPHSGEKYLQIAAFGPRALDGFLRTLEGQGLHPVVAPGPVDNIYRILVGPFPNSAALEETRSLIKASGIEPILRAY